MKMSNYYQLELPDIYEACNLITDFMNHQIIRKLADSTLVSMKIEALRFFSIFQPKDIKFEFIHQYISDYFSTYSSSTKNNRYSTLRAILKYLYKKGYDNCKFNLHSAKVDRKIPDFLSIEETKLLIKKLQRHKSKHEKLWIGRRNYALFLTMYATGMRRSEIINMSIEDLQDGWIRVNNGKGAKDRLIPIAPKAEMALREYWEYLPARPKRHYCLAFYDDNLIPYTTHSLWRECVNTFGFNPHVLRHTFATHLILKGCDVAVLADFMGHSSLITTQIYTHIQPQHLSETLRRCHPMSKENASK